MNIAIKLKEILSDTLKIPVEKIKDDFKQVNSTRWDSLAQIIIISKIESEFNISIEPEEIEELKSFMLLLKRILQAIE